MERAHKHTSTGDYTLIVKRLLHTAMRLIAPKLSSPRHCTGAVSSDGNAIAMLLVGYEPMAIMAQALNLTLYVTGYPATDADRVRVAAAKVSEMWGSLLAEESRMPDIEKPNEVVADVGRFKGIVM